MFPEDIWQKVFGFLDSQNPVILYFLYKTFFYDLTFLAQWLVEGSW